jgi:hypothetical protein
LCRFETKFPEMKKLGLAFVLMLSLCVYSCNRHDAAKAEEDAKKKDSIEDARKRNDILKAADSMNAPDKSDPKSGSSKTK